MRKLRILVVDDNQDFCDSVKDILELTGHKVLTAYDGQSALELVLKEHLDLVLVDLVMPGMDGVSTIKAIRKIASSLPITVVTAFGGEIIVREALRAGANDILSKPVDFHKLLAKVGSDHQP